MGVKIHIKIPATVTRFSPIYQKAQKWLDNEVLKDSTPYVPMATGNLVGSGIRGTVIGSGKVIYNAPYAKSCYYAKSRNFSKEKHPQASAQWFEKSKAAKGKAWEKGVNAIFKE